MVNEALAGQRNYSQIAFVNILRMPRRRPPQSAWIARSYAMDKLHQQVRRARGRMNLQSFLGVLIWSIFAWLIVAAVALGVPKLWAVGFAAATAQIYTWSIVGGAVALGLATAGMITWLRRRNELEAAIELDHRYGLKERISSTLALTPEELHSEAGQALLNDALRRVERIDIGEKFGVRADWKAALPLVPALVVFVLAMFVPDAIKREDAEASARNVEIRKQVKAATENLKKPIKDLKQEAEEKGLTDAEAVFDKLEQGLENLANKDKADKKQAMVQLNNLAKQIKDRSDRLKDSDDIKQQMNDLKDLKQGPADNLADALKEGDFKQAVDEMKKLEEQLKQEGLGEKEQQQLKEQLQQMQEKLQNMADAQQQAQQSLKEQIEKAKEQGDLAQAGKLQQKLDQMQQQQQSMDKLQQMAQQLGQAAQSLEQGDQQAAAQQLEELGDQLSQLAQQDEELEMLEDAMDQISQAKESMNCKQCQGQGCEQCQGQGLGQGQGRGRKDGNPGRGMGEGRGKGARPEQENKTGSYDSQVRGKVGQGEATVVGEANGPNKAGEAREEINTAIRTATEGTANPLTNERLPRSQRDHVKEYYDSFRKGGS
jgi:hypothetical protein